MVVVEVFSPGPSRDAGFGRRWPARAALVALATVALALSAAGCGGGSSRGTVGLAWYIFPEPSGSFDQAAKECSRASNGEYRITIHDLPNDADGQRQQMVRRLAAGRPRVALPRPDAT